MEHRSILRTLLLPLWLGASVVSPGWAPAEEGAGLRLADIFEAEQPPGRVRSGTIRRNGPVLTVPDTSAWRLPPPEPTPTPEPTPVLPEGFDVPYLPPLIAAEDPDRDRTGQPGLIFRGLIPNPPEEGHALLRFDTRLGQLRTEYRLQRVDEEGAPQGEPLILLHAPRTEEEFAVPAGRYRLERRVWRADYPENVRREIYDPQGLEPRGRYEFTTVRDPEMRWLNELRQRAPRRATPGEPLPAVWD